MEEFKKRYARLNTSQRKAVDTIEGPVLVIAGPGTGKTELLGMRVANILLEESSGATPQNILCLTFTESAAYEMRQRLINIIGQQAYNVTISTYHAFGSELLQRFPDYFQNTLGMQAVDELGTHTILQNIISQLPYTNPLKKSEYYIRDIKSSISDCKRALLNAKDLRKVAQGNQKDIKILSDRVRDTLGNIPRINKNSTPLFVKLLETIQDNGVKEIAHKDVRSLAWLFKNDLQNALQESSLSGKATPLVNFKNNWLVRDEHGEYTMDGKQVNDRILALADIYDAYLTELNNQELFDYDDMILKAIDGLENNADLRYSLQEQYTYLLLDEFQDTNAAQLKLVTLLTDNPVHEGRPNVMAVGDDDQAIYAFQGADYSHMLEFKNRYRDAKVICLTDNYRSHSDILHVAHGVAEQIESRLHHHLTDINKLLAAKNDSLPTQANIARHEFKSDIAQYAWVTKQISKLIKSGVEPQEIAVLAPQHKYLEPLIPYLRQVKVPVHYDKRENVLEDRHIRQLLRMSEQVLNIQANRATEADSLWPEILSYDFWELPAELIWNLSWEAADTRVAWSKVLMSNPKTKLIVLFFSQLSALSTIESLETMLDYLIGSQPLTNNQESYTSPFYAFNFSGEAQTNVSSFWNVLSNLTVLRQRLREFTKYQESSLYLTDLVNFALAHNEANIKILNTSPYHEASNAVQVMTAYKSKGMEFGHVFLLACVDEVWGNRATKNSSKVSLPPNLKFVRYQGADNDERLRLLFVAITRAKYGLYLTSYAANFANKLTTRLQFLQEVDDGKHIISPLLPQGANKVIVTPNEAPVIDDLNAYWQQRHFNPLNDAKFKDLLKPRLDRYQMAPTHLNSFSDLVYGGPEHFFLHTLLRFPKAPTVDGEFGNLIHSCIEWLHLEQRKAGNLPTLAELQKAMEQNLQNCNISSGQKILVGQRAVECLKSFYAQRKNTFSVIDEHEIGFKGQGVFVGNAHLNGMIDKLVINKKDRTITVVDYKTGKSYSSWRSDPKLHKYKQQLYFYKLLVEGSHRFADYTVNEAYLEFVEPDENGVINTLNLNFNSDELQDLNKLINSVWEHIKSLDFPDTSAYPKTIAGIQQFEQDLINGTI